MTILEERRFDGGEGQLAGAGGTSGWWDVFEASRQQALQVDNHFARSNLIEEAYEQRIEAIAKATGQRLTSPTRRGAVGMDGFLDDIEGQRAESEADHFTAFDRQLADLAERYPDLRDVIRPDRSPREEAREKARNAERTAGDTLNRYHGPAGTGTLAALAGGMAGMVQDPVNAGSMLLGPWQGAGAGLKGLLWMAVRQGAWNAGTEAALQPNVAAWRTEAGLGYDAGDFARNVGTAFAFGGALDLGVRGGYRAIQGARGLVPRLNGDGTVRDFVTPEQALEEATLRTQSQTLRAAREGDELALRQLARETGVDQDPDVRVMLDLMDNRRVNDPRLPGTDPHEHEAAMVQTDRHLADKLEPLPVIPPPLRAADGVSLSEGLAPDVPRGGAVEVDGRAVWREASDGTAEGHAVIFERADGVRERLGDDLRADAWVLRQADGWTRADVETVAARKRLGEGGLEPLEAAVLMREYPDAVDARVSLAGAGMRQARALARLDETAFDMVAMGEIDARLGALVGDLVPNPAEHAGMLRKLQGYAPGSEAEARQAIGVLMARPGRQSALEKGIDDVTGPEGDVQIAQLERMLADDIAAAEGRAKVAGDDAVPLTPREVMAERLAKKVFDDTPEAAFAEQWSQASRMEIQAQLMEACKL